MTPVLNKEIRLMLPAWLAAVGLCLLPFLVGSVIGLEHSYPGHIQLALYTVPLSCSILGLSVFGREFSSNTYSTLLAQPLPRVSFWRVKLLVLSISVLTVLLVVMFTSLLFTQLSSWKEAGTLMWMWTLAALVGATSALWLTLLLRQLLAAFLLALLVPLALMLLINAIPNLKNAETMVVIAMVVYSVGGLLSAWKLFLTAQDVAWTGGAVTLPSLHGNASREMNAGVRQSNPIWALARKEFQYQQISLLLAAMLFVMNLAVLGGQRMMTVENSSVWRMHFEWFWILWLIVPLMIGCLAVAEERRLGTLEPQLCLPVSRPLQFSVKVVSVLLLTLLSGALALLLMVIGKSSAMNDSDAVYALPIGFAFISLLGLYASTVSRHFLQAFAVAIGLIVAVFLVGHFLLRPPTVGGYNLWEGKIGMLVAGGMAMLLALAFSSWRGRMSWALFLVAVWVLFIFRDALLSAKPMVAAQRSPSEFLSAVTGPGVVVGLLMLALTLAFRNFRHVQSGVSLCVKNVAVWMAGLTLTTVVAAAAYHRVWELVLPFEPAAGPARLGGDVRPMIAEYFRGGWLLALLPDGRLWTMRRYETDLLSGEWTGNESGWRVVPIRNPRGVFVGSNWVSMGMSLYDAAGVQADGSLWRISWWETDDENGKPTPAGAGHWHRKGQILRQTPMTLTRIGEDSDWAMVAAGGAHFLALKRDGTMWGWGNNSSGQLSDDLPERVRAPMQIGDDSDWELISTFWSVSVAAKRDNSVWKWGEAYPITTSGIGKGCFGGTMRRIATLPSRPTRMESTRISDVFICEDGSGWGLGLLRGNFLGSNNSFPMLTELTRLWENGRWTEVQIEGYPNTGGIQKEGTLWMQRSDHSYPMKLPDPQQLGKRNDWICLRKQYGPIYALAKDGTLCRFGEEIHSEQPLLAPTRRVTWRVNVLDSVR